MDSLRNSPSPINPTWSGMRSCLLFGECSHAEVLHSVVRPRRRAFAVSAQDRRLRPMQILD